MNFGSLQEVLTMGGHGPFVWSAYGIALVVIGFNLVWPARAERKTREQLKRRVLAEEQAET